MSPSLRKHLAKRVVSVAAVFAAFLALFISPIVSAQVCSPVPLALPTAGNPVYVAGSFSAGDCTTNPRAGGQYTDRYSVTLAAGERITIDLRGQSALIDTYIHLTNIGGGVLTSSDDYGTAGAATTNGSLIWRHTVAGAGTYVIVASPYSANVTGAYVLAVVRDAAPVTCSLDMNGDSQIIANKEGLILVRSMLGFSAANAVVGTRISEAQWNSMRSNLNTNCGTNFIP